MADIVVELPPQVNEGGSAVGNEIECQRESSMWSIAWQKAVQTLQREGDGDDVRERKRMVAPLAGMGGVLSAVYLTEAAIKGDYMMIGVFAALIVFGCVVPVAYVALRDCPKWLYEAQLLLFVVSIILVDLHHSGLYDEWLYSLLLLDLASSPQENRLGCPITALTSLWVILKTVEEAYDLGIYATGTHHPDEVGKGTRFFIHALFVRCLIVISHYFWKQKLSVAVANLNGEMDSIVSSVEMLSKAMSRYSLNEIANAADSAKDTRIEMIMEDLYLTLSHYRPYISEALFVGPGASKSDKASFKCLHSQSIQRQSTLIEPDNRVSFTTADSSHQNSGFWNTLEQLERDRASSLTRGIRRGSSLAIEGIPFMVGSRSYLKKMVAVAYISIVNIIEDLPDDLVGPVSLGFLEKVFDCVGALSGIIHSFDATSVLATFIRAPCACRCALSVRTRLGTFLKRYASVGTTLGSLQIGIAFGQVYFGNVGTPARLVYTAFGSGVTKAVNVAALNAQIGSVILCTSDIQFRSKNEITLTPVSHQALTDEQYFQVEEDISGTSGYSTLFRNSSFCRRPSSARGDPLCADERSRRILGRKEPDWEPKPEHRPSIQSIQNLIDESEDKDKPVRNPLTASRHILKPIRSSESISVETPPNEELVDTFLQRIKQHQTSIAEVLSFSPEHQTRFVRTVMPSLSPEAVDFVVTSLQSEPQRGNIPTDFVAFPEQPVADRVAPLEAM